MPWPWLNPVWILLAGFLLGWIASTLFEWLWYRRYRGISIPPPRRPPLQDIRLSRTEPPALPAWVEETLTPTPAPEAMVPGVAPSPSSPGRSERPAPASPRPSREGGITPPATNVPDDLTRIRGIGKAHAQRLYRAGIATYHQLAQTDPATLHAVTYAGPTVDVESWQRRARELAEQEDRVGAVYTGPPPDDFTELPGLSPDLQHRLYQRGIVTFAQLAQATPEQLAEILPTVADRNLLARWIAGAARRSQPHTSP